MAGRRDAGLLDRLFLFKAFNAQLLLAERAELRDQVIRPRVALHALFYYHDFNVVRNLSEREQRFPPVRDELVVHTRVLRHDVKVGLKRAAVLQHGTAPTRE